MLSPLKKFVHLFSSSAFEASPLLKLSENMILINKPNQAIGFNKQYFVEVNGHLYHLPSTRENEDNIGLIPLGQTSYPWEWLKKPEPQIQPKVSKPKRIAILPAV